MSVMTPEGAPRGWSPANPELRVSTVNSNPYDGVSDKELRLLSDQLFDANMIDEHNHVTAELKRRSEAQENN